MRLETCTVSLPPPTLGAMLATFGQLTEFRVAFGGSRGTVTLIYGDKRRKRTRGKKPSAPWAAKGEPKPAAKLPAAVPSFVPPPAQPGASREVQGGPKLVAKPPVAGPSGNRSPASSPTRTTRTGPRQMFPTHTSTLRSSTTGSTLLPAAPVEPPVTMEVPVEQVAGSGGGLESTSRLPLTRSQTCHANRLRTYGRFSQMRWAKSTSGWRAEVIQSWL